MSYKSWRNSLTTNAETIIKEKWPETAMKIHESIDDKKLSQDRLPIVRRAGIIKKSQNGNLSNGIKRKRENTNTSTTEVTPNPDTEKSTTNNSIRPYCDLEFIDNQIIHELFEDEKKLVLSLLEDIQTVRMWITLNVPKIEDGNNFGVGVQEEILNELKQCESEFEGLLQQPGSYYASRGKVISKCIKYPEIKDYVNYVEECDEKVFLMHRMTLIDIRNSLVTILDMMEKNMDKIKKPKGKSSSMHMY